MGTHLRASPAVTIVSAIISPALLILGSASLIATALVRLARAVDRARSVAISSGLDSRTLGCERHYVKRWLTKYLKKAQIAEATVTAPFAAVGVFIVACLSFAVDHFTSGKLTWLIVGLTIFGMARMFYEAHCMLVESRLSTLQIREDFECIMRLT